MVPLWHSILLVGLIRILMLAYYLESLYHWVSLGRISTPLLKQATKGAWSYHEVRDSQIPYPPLIRLFYIPMIRIISIKGLDVTAWKMSIESSVFVPLITYKTTNLLGPRSLLCQDIQLQQWSLHDTNPNNAFLFFSGNPSEHFGFQSTLIIPSQNGGF